ncbi:MAG: 2,3-cyclic 3-phosphodiesterase [Thermoleophilaceae bacterium]|nr:2,3-cyclic 3-phosphodiesterase [Thermoleophilaceae bacterium]
MPLPDSARLFVALELPARVRMQLVEWRSAAIGDRDDLRLVAADSLHVTLAFLGSRPMAEVEAIAAAVSDAVSGLKAARLQAAGVKAVPRRRPRLFAVDLADPDGACAALQAAVAGALEAGGHYKPERRDFWPHVTVARVVRGARTVPPITTPPPASPFTAREVTLYRSHLGGGPARYEALGRWRLKPLRG